MAKMGRPPKPARERQSKMVNLRLTPAEYKKLEEIAAGEHVSISDYLRHLLGFRSESK
jgi:hypothetical protein